MLTTRAAEIPPFIVMDVLEAAQEMERNGADIIHLEVGEPDFDTPECIKEDCIRALREGKTHYTHSLGLIELRKAHVGVAPGIDFGENAEGYLRFSYASSLENIREGINRIERYLRDRRGF